MNMVCAVFAGVLLTTACAAVSGEKAVSRLGERFSLHVGESVSIPQQGLHVQFDAVVADSRCAKGEQCVWAGDGIIRVSLHREDDASESRELHTASQRARIADFNGFTVELLALDPARIAGRAIDPANYIATLKVAVGSVAEDGSR